MTIYDVRLRNLETIIDQQFGGVRSRLADALGIESTYISRFYAKGEGRRNIGNKFARKLESIANKPDGWLDKEHNVIREHGASYSIDDGINWDKFADILEVVEVALKENGISIGMTEMLELANLFYDMDADSAPKKSAVIKLYDFKRRAAGG